MSDLPQSIAQKIIVNNLFKRRKLTINNLHPLTKRVVPILSIEIPRVVPGTYCAIVVNKPNLKNIFLKFSD